MPMQSVYKLPLGIYILSQVDKGVLKMDQKILIRPSDYSPTWSPIMEKYPDANVELSLEEVLMNTITWSDNVGCDLLFRLAGGPLVVNEYFHSLGIKDIAIRYTEKEMHDDWDVQYENWCTPMAMLQVLERIYKLDLLSKSSSDFLWKNMADCPLGKSRLRGLLPSETEVGHRTGTSSRNERNMIGALNDVGIMKLTDGTQIAIVVYTSNSMEEQATLEAVIAKIAKAAYDHYTK
jgi:beta-lactamase class A